MPEKNKEESNDKTLLRLVIPILFIVLVATLVYAIYPLFAVDYGADIILNTISLRTETNTLRLSTLVTETDNMIRDMDNRQLQGEWKALTSCMADSCSDTDFFNFITLVTQNTDIENKALIQNMILTYKHWDSEEIVRFSKALTAVTRGVEDTYSRSLDQKWKAILECDGKCDNENDLFFGAIKIVAQLS